MAALIAVQHGADIVRVHDCGRDSRCTEDMECSQWGRSLELRLLERIEQPRNLRAGQTEHRCRRRARPGR